mmetsp:Transcript_63970/g.177822  ORF Transcript_63970/g.177822 Transcript_63970/m.177822 type:complete len:407 (+) Transcript_63970:199-1419(+)
MRVSRTLSPTIFNSSFFGLSKTFFFDSVASLLISGRPACLPGRLRVCLALKAALTAAAKFSAMAASSAVVTSSSPSSSLDSPSSSSSSAEDSSSEEKSASVASSESLPCAACAASAASLSRSSASLAALRAASFFARSSAFSSCRCFLAETTKAAPSPTLSALTASSSLSETEAFFTALGSFIFAGSGGSDLCTAGSRSAALAADFLASRLFSDGSPACEARKPKTSNSTVATNVPLSASSTLYLIMSLVLVALVAFCTKSCKLSTGLAYSRVTAAWIAPGSGPSCAGAVRLASGLASSSLSDSSSCCCCCCCSSSCSTSSDVAGVNGAAGATAGLVSPLANFTSKPDWPFIFSRADSASASAANSTKPKARLAVVTSSTERISPNVLKSSLSFASVISSLAIFPT